MTKRFRELAPAIATVLAWLLITYAIAGVARPRIVWPLSLGLLCLSVPGLKNLRDIFAEGLHSLMHDPLEEHNDA